MKIPRIQLIQIRPSRSAFATASGVLLQSERLHAFARCWRTARSLVGRREIIKHHVDAMEVVHVIGWLVMVGALIGGYTVMRGWPPAGGVPPFTRPSEVLPYSTR